MGEYEVLMGMSSWNPFISLNIKFEACLPGPSVILQPAENRNKTKEGVGVRKEVMSTMRERAFHPRNLGGFSVVYTNKPGGKSLTDLIF